MIIVGDKKNYKWIYFLYFFLLIYSALGLIYINDLFLNFINFILFILTVSPTQ